MESVKGTDGNRADPLPRKVQERPHDRVWGSGVRRRGYSAKGVESLFPLDRELNLPEHKYSSNLCRLVAEAGAESSFDEAAERIRNTTGGTVPKRQIIEQTVKATLDFDAFYALPTSFEETSNLLVHTVDGKGIVMRREDLRPATRKAAEEQKDLPGSRLTPGKKRKPQAHGHSGSRLHSGNLRSAHPSRSWDPKRRSLPPREPKTSGCGPASSTIAGR